MFTLKDVRMIDVFVVFRFNIHITVLGYEIDRRRELF